MIRNALSDTPSSGLRIGAVSYLNTKPLIDGLEDSLSLEDRLRLDLPSRLADCLTNDSLDVALIPSIEFFQDEGYRIVSDACIACRGPVWSVRLLFRVPPSKVQSMALDEGSRTSAALSKILLHERFGLRPDCLPLPILSDPFDAEGDAVLVIGDRAMKPKMDGFLSEWDLGEEWFRETGLSFVFAMWVTKMSTWTSQTWPSKLGRSLAELEHQLEFARDRGVAEAKELANRYASEYGLSNDECYRYLSHHLRYKLGPLEHRGLKLFYEKAIQLGLAPQARDADKFRMAPI